MEIAKRQRFCVAKPTIPGFKSVSIGRILNGLISSLQPEEAVW